MLLSRLLVITAAAACVVPASATAASTVTSDGSSGGQITFVVTSGKTDMASSNTPTPAQFVDAAGPLTAAGACLAGPPVSCPGFSITALLGSRADRAKVASLGPVALTGGLGSDQLYGWGSGVTIDAGAGDDVAIGDANGGATLNGGNGDDRLFGRGAGLSIDAGPGADFAVSDSNGPPTVTGQDGADTLVGLNHGLGGSLSGGLRADVLVVSGTPLIAIAGWTVDGGAGADQIDVSGDGTGADAVTCGPGHDIVWADAADSVAADCETVLAGPAPAWTPVAAAARDAATMKAAVAMIHPNALTPGPLPPGV